MRVKVITEINEEKLELKIQNFLDNPDGLDDNQQLTIYHIKYSTVHFGGGGYSVGSIQYSVVIIYNGKQ